jgi:hypothetical protein
MIITTAATTATMTAANTTTTTVNTVFTIIILKASCFGVSLVLLLVFGKCLVIVFGAT